MFLFSRLKMYFVAAAVVFAAIVAAYLRGKKQGEHEYEREADKHLIDSMRMYREVQDEINDLDDIGLGERASKWLRESGDS